MCLDSVFGGGSKTAQRQSQMQFEINRQDAQAREAQTKADEAARQGRITQGQGAIDSAFSNFNDGYYNKYASDYSGYYTPQLDEQYGQAKQNLTYVLAGKGLTQSSIGAKMFGDLQKRYDDTKLQVASQGADAVRSLKSNIESNKNDLYSLNTSSADPSAISNRALASASALTAAPTYQPLGDVFGTALGTAATALKANQSSLTPAASTSGLVNRSKGSGQVVN